MTQTGPLALSPLAAALFLTPSISPSRCMTRSTWPNSSPRGLVGRQIMAGGETMCRNAALLLEKSGAAERQQ